MKVKSVVPSFVDKYLFVQITTEDGTTGIGESGAWGHLEASAAAIVKCGEYLIGRDARQIEHHWNAAAGKPFHWRCNHGRHFTIDIALWDIKGKSLGVPIFELLGGCVRDKIRTLCPRQSEDRRGDDFRGAPS
ncbi:hypothetical protein LP421_33030 (plasmid) [Rhizobium sp. RCAM05350]|uniref:hypothetical protein n=1 Tax=Rhizobium sp. RCAM05350 TaxID=2895568 RepID=UPI00207686D4|nr:hypothetical protein [Rhizobium sp. RCAM05350]URK89487.1 hypothetical protein LP421_33030 [Rhizobium sp. RCAM05350]